MIAQLINFSHQNSFQFYKNKYKILNEFQDGFGLEVREIPANYIQILKNNFTADSYFNGVNLLITGSLTKLNFMISVIEKTEIGIVLKKILNSYKNYEDINYKIGQKDFSFKRSYVMGILNITPDSFSDGGLYFNTENAVNHALKMIEEGADIIDIGGESTRPGAESISSDEELNRIIPVLEKIIKLHPDAIISVDTTKSKVAEESLRRGAKIINDISGLTFDEGMADVVKKYNAAIVVMHIKGTPADMQKNPFYENPVEEIYNFLYEQSEKANKLGVEKIFIDPGIGFGKRIEDNFELIRRLDDFKSLGFPVLIGVSRKSFIGKTLNTNIMDRDTATAITEAIAVKNGAKIIRTHNVKFGVQTINLLKNLK